LRAGLDLRDFSRRQLDGLLFASDDVNFNAVHGSALVGNVYRTGIERIGAVDCGDADTVKSRTKI